MNPPRQHPPLTAFLVGVLGIAMFSGMDAVMKGLVIALGTFATIFWRNLVGVGMAGALYLAQPSPWPSQSTMRLHVGRGLLSTVMGFLFFWGLARVPLAQAIALAFIAPLIALFLAAVLLKETVGGRTVGAGLVAFVGVLVIFVGQAQADLGREATIGSLAILASAVCYALNIILMRQQAQVAGPVEIAFFQSLVVTLVAAALIPMVGIEFPAAIHWPWLVFAASLAIASHMLLSWAYARAEANYLAATEFTSFLWAALFGWLIFHEALSPYTLAGAALIVAGCILAASKPGDATPRLEAAT